MADLKIPNLNMKSEKYIFKKKFTLRRKSKKRLLTESGFMFILGLLLVYINYLIPNKNLLFQNLPLTFNKSFILIIELISNLYEIFLVIFIFISSIITFILLMGSFYRLFKIGKRKTTQIGYK
ncbi:nucleoside-diphosphate kinase [Prochlorococcus marinus str. MU1416]|nr:nucleoside-diphosphate kinase [Prochlorococcus marinus CUG1416]MBW3051551.1 nucleoside-diphosphate kinase [Prochlorococcus marinus str. MU1416]